MLEKLSNEHEWSNLSIIIDLLNKNEWISDWMFKWMNVQRGEAEDLPGGDDWRGGVQVRDHIPRHVHLSSLLLVNNFITRCVTF